MYLLNFEQEIPSRNQVDKMHWKGRYRVRRDWQWSVREAVLNLAQPVKQLRRAKIVIERHARRRLDQDNFIGGAKYLLDSLVAEGFVADDSPAHVQVEYLQIPGAPHTLVRIEALP